MVIACGNEYTNQANSPSMQYNDWWDIPSSPYSLRQSTFLACPSVEDPPCDPTPDCAVNIYKDSRGTYLGSHTWCDADESFDNGGICIHSSLLNCDTYAYAKWTVYFNVCTTYNDVYINSSTGNDLNCGNIVSSPVKTFVRAYALANAGGTIHILNSGADFSTEIQDIAKSLNIDLNGADGFWFMPKNA